MATRTAALEVTSSGIRPGGRIPRRHAYQGEGENLSPPLAWSAPPAGTLEQALICDDPDAPRAEPWVHWVLYALPPGVTALPEGVPVGATVRQPQGALQGRNDWGQPGWGGPMPPKGHGTHHYRFRVYALDRALGLEGGATRQEVERAMRGHVLAQGELVGTYER